MIWISFGDLELFLCLFGVVWIESMCLHLCVGTVADLWLEGDVDSQQLGDGVRMCRPSLVGVGPPKYIIVPCPVASHMVASRVTM